ncbi:hypothetical protein D3C83_322490 [compost metagenome]
MPPDPVAVWIDGLLMVVPFSEALSGCEVNWKVLKPPNGATFNSKLVTSSAA